MNQELLDFKWMENDKLFFCFIPEFYYSISQPKFHRLANTLKFKYNLINSYLSPNSKILDPCSGSGFGAWMLKNSGHDVTCIENNPFLVWVTKKRGINSILEDSILDIELKNDEYDGIVFIDAIEHLYEEDQNKILSKFFNILKPGGPDLHVPGAAAHPTAGAAPGGRSGGRRRVLRRGLPGRVPGSRL